MSEVYRYSLACAQIAMEEEFDVVHVHDWMTYPAGILIKQLTGKSFKVRATLTDRQKAILLAGGLMAQRKADSRS